MTRDFFSLFGGKINLNYTKKLEQNFNLEMHFKSNLKNNMEMSGPIVQFNNNKK